MTKQLLLWSVLYISPDMFCTSLPDFIMKYHEEVNSLIELKAVEQPKLKSFRSISQELQIQCRMAILQKRFS